MAGAGKDKVDVIKQELPKFIREFKERTGKSAQQVPDINSKRPSEDQNGGDDETELFSEAPLISLGEGVTEEEAYTFAKEKFGEDAVSKNLLKRKQDDQEVECGKVMFKKPGKEQERGEDDPIPKNLTQCNTKPKKQKQYKPSKMPQVKNKTLLSFDEEEDDDT